MRYLKYKTIKQENTGEVSAASVRVKPVNWVMLAVYILVYIIFIYIIIRFSSKEADNWGSFQWKGMTRTGLVGIIAQCQSLVILLMILSPVKLGKYIAIILTIQTAISAIISTIYKQNMDSLAGVLMPVSTIVIAVVITRYTNNLNKQMKKISEYNRIIKDNEEILQHMAYYDLLTGLPNRAMMISEMDKLTRDTMLKNKEFTFVFLDLDNFKKINDSMGHIVGDEILKQVALRWKEHIHEEDFLGRLGGDEFALLINKKMSKEELMEYMEELKKPLSVPFLWDKKEFIVSASFGITTYPNDGSDATELMKNADIALYKAKYNGKNSYQFFNSEVMEEVLTYIKLDNGLQSAVRNQEFFMVYQPIYECIQGELRGYEALIRWKHSELGLVSPMDFISIAEVNGTIIEIGRWVLFHVLSTFMEYQKSHEIKAMISINISVVQMLEPSFVPMVEATLSDTGFDGSCLEFEITESVLISSPEKIIQVIKKLSELGIRFALDDFGTGYASLSSLQLLRPHLLKIDKSLIEEITTENPMSQIVGSIITLAHQIDIKVVAEGVEKEEQLDYLKKNHCDYFQGYLYSKPISEEQVLAYQI